MRRVQVSNIPMYLGLSEIDLKIIVLQFLMNNYLCDEGNNEPITELELDRDSKFLTVELSSSEEANRFAKAKTICILGINCKL
jgi:hypothetical protein